MESKFAHFNHFCKEHKLYPMSAHCLMIYWYIYFLHDDGQISISSLPQYLVAISMVH